MKSYVLGPNLQQDGVTADSFGALAEIAIRDLRARAMPVSMVCGPITSGGTGHPMLNFEIFNAVIHGLQQRGVELFSQLPYEFGLRQLARKWEEAGNSGYCYPVLEEFYAPIFEAGLICGGWFIPGWESSIGARWERNRLSARKALVTDLWREDIEDFMRQTHTPEHIAKVMALLPK